ncbi:MAG: YqhA family protein [Microcoleaceae cyanobacterium]
MAIIDQLREKLWRGLGTKSPRRGDDLERPAWFQVRDISELKKKLLEVLIVLLSVLFVKRTLETATLGNIQWQILMIPLTIVAIAVSVALLGRNDEPEA